MYVQRKTMSFSVQLSVINHSFLLQPEVHRYSDEHVLASYLLIRMVGVVIVFNSEPKCLKMHVRRKFKPTFLLLF